MLTNDPKNPVLVCRVQGTVLQLVETAPTMFSFSGITPGSDAEMSIVVTSQVWDKFDLSDVHASMDGLLHNVTPFTAEEAAEREVKDGFHVAIKLPQDLPRGEFSETLRMRLTPAEGTPEIFEIPITGRVLRRGFRNGRWNPLVRRLWHHELGSRSRRQRHQESLFWSKFVTQSQSLRSPNWSRFRSFLEVQFQEAGFGVPGLYRMEVEVPKSAPPSFYSAEQGRLHVEFENPRFEDLDLSIELAVGDDS